MAIIIRKKKIDFNELKDLLNSEFISEELKQIIKQLNAENETNQNT